MSKRAAILCPGPSLASAPLGVICERHGADGPHSPPLFDLVLAVNTAANAAPIDVWVFQDAPAWQIAIEHGGLPVNRLRDDEPPALSVRSELCRQIEDPRFPAWFSRPNLIPTELLDEHWQPIDRPPPFKSFSSMVAAVTAVALGAESIEVWGHDCSGDTDYRGRRCLTRRDDERWAQERRYWSGLLRWLAQRGVAFTRHTAGAAPLAWTAPAVTV